MVPDVVNGRAQIPFMGVGKYRPTAARPRRPCALRADYPENGDKRVADLATALASAACAMA